MNEPKYIAIDRALRNSPGDRLRCYPAKKTAAFYALCDAPDKELYLGIGLKRYRRAARLAKKWASIVGQGPPNTPLLIAPWPETATAYEGDLFSWAMQTAPGKCFGQTAEDLVGEITEMCAPLGFPEEIRHVERVPFVRFALSQYLFQHDRHGRSPESGHAWFDWPVASHLKHPPIAEALVRVRGHISMEHGMGASVRADKTLLSEWRSDHPQPAGAHFSPEEEAQMRDREVLEKAELEARTEKWVALRKGASDFWGQTKRLVALPWSERPDVKYVDRLLPTNESERTMSDKERLHSQAFRLAASLPLTSEQREVVNVGLVDWNPFNCLLNEHLLDLFRQANVSLLQQASFTGLDGFDFDPATGKLKSGCTHPDIQIAEENAGALVQAFEEAPQLSRI